MAGRSDATATTKASAAAANAGQYEATSGTAADYSDATAGTAETGKSHELGDRECEGASNTAVVVRERRQPIATNSGKLVATKPEIEGSAELASDTIRSATAASASNLAAAFSEIVGPSTAQQWCSTEPEDDTFRPTWMAAK